mgnify:CR=1 FL=1
MIEPKHYNGYAKYSIMVQYVAKRKYSLNLINSLKIYARQVKIGYQSSDTNIEQCKDTTSSDRQQKFPNVMPEKKTGNTNILTL